MDALLPQFMKAAGVTEELKARDQMTWVGLMNNCKTRAEKVIFEDSIYCWSKKLLMLKHWEFLFPSVQ